ncbi:MAG: HNH endonuclease signature motif containing protein [Geobacteraceae bacterium]
MRFRYGIEHIEYLRSGYRKMGIPELTAAFNEEFGLNKSWQMIRSTLKNHNLTCGRKTGNLNKGKSQIFTADQVQFIEKEFQNLSVADLTTELNRTFETDFKISQIKAFTKNHKILSGRTGQFGKGQVSWNKGRKGYMGANVTSFKKGSIPPNRKLLWTERIDSKDGFILIKVPEMDPSTGFPTRYKHKHVWVWEQANGPVPEGHAVVFVDSNKLNCEIENLMLLTRAELLSLNLHGYKEMPVELKPVVLSLAKLETKAKIRTRPGRGRVRAKQKMGGENL